MITAQRITKYTTKMASRFCIAARTALGARKALHCPACNSAVVDFFRYGECAQWGCPQCAASPRERLVNYMLDIGQIALPTTGAILHVAPGEASLVKRFGGSGSTYMPADLDPARYSVAGIIKVDLMDIGMSGQIDLFYASHVMEHVPDDALVLRNIFAALCDGGEAWLIVPLWDKPSEDGAGDLSGAERERRFGQWDHVRQYGLDFADRIRAAGFEVDLLRASDMPEAAVKNMALDDIIFRARKPAAAQV